MPKEVEKVQDKVELSAEVAAKSVEESTEKSTEISDESEENSNNVSLEIKEIKTPSKPLTPKQLKRKEEIEKKRLLKQQEKEEREKKKEEERLERLKKKQEELDELAKKKQKEKEERQKQKDEKEEKKRQEREAKQKEKIDKRKEKEEQEEMKRKAKEEKRGMKHKEIEEKERKKQLEQELKEKAAKAFTQFFVTKKSDLPVTETKKEDVVNTNFMPFCIKPDMRLAPVIRRALLANEKEAVVNYLEAQTNDNYLSDLKAGKTFKRTCGRTWTVDESENDDIMIIDENSQSGMIAQERKVDKMRAKVLQFSENRRPAYFGTWRKKSTCVKPRKPFAQDTNHFDYEVDSDDDWEEEVQGESLEAGSDEEDKDAASENDYEEDNEFFVPHGYLSDGEGEDEDNVPMSPEAHKAKLKLLKSTFDEEIKSKTERLKPVLIGCIWEEKIGKVQNAFRSILQSRAMITNGIIEVKKRDLTTLQTPTSHRKSLGERNKQQPKPLSKELIPTFLKLVHGNIKNQMFIVNEFQKYLTANDIPVEQHTKGMIKHQLKALANWMKCPEEGPLYNKNCWYVSEEVRQQYNADLSIPNKWNYTLDA